MITPFRQSALGISIKFEVPDPVFLQILAKVAITGTLQSREDF